MLYRVTVLIATGIVLISLACGDTDPTSTPQPTEAPRQTESPTNGSGDMVTVENWDLGGSGEYVFVPAEYHFSVGQTVTFEMSAETEVHTFTVDELDIDEIIGPGQTITFTHTFDQEGEFELICTPHLAFGMTGTITVS